jgi:hypothetical protein
MTLRKKISSMTDEEINILADAVCDLVHEAVEDAPEDVAACDVCPFTKYCSKGKIGFAEFLKEEADNYI